MYKKLWKIFFFFEWKKSSFHVHIITPPHYNDFCNHSWPFIFSVQLSKALFVSSNVHNRVKRTHAHLFTGLVNNLYQRCLCHNVQNHHHAQRTPTVTYIPIVDFQLTNGYVETTRVNSTSKMMHLRCILILLSLVAAVACKRSSLCGPRESWVHVGSSNGSKNSNDQNHLQMCLVSIQILNVKKGGSHKRSSNPTIKNWFNW